MWFGCAIPPPDIRWAVVWCAGVELVDPLSIRAIDTRAGQSGLSRLLWSSSMFRLNRPAAIFLASTFVAVPALAFQPQTGSGGDGTSGRGGSAQGDQPRQRERRNQGGQGFGGGFGGFMGRGGQNYDASITSDDLKHWGDRLKLSGEQRQTADALFEAYQTQFAADAKVSREKVESLREEARQAQDMSIMQEIMTERQGFQKKREALEKSFFDDMKAILDEQQAAEWPRIERDRRREQTLGQGIIAGERVDVVKLVDDLKLPAEQLSAVQPLLDQYKDELDRELVARNEAYETFQTKMREMMQGGRMAEMFAPGATVDPEMEKLVVKGREAGNRVRDVNRKFVRQIEPMLPEAQRSAFSAEVKRESYPMIYRPAYGTRVLDAADKISAIDDSQRAALQGIRESYTRDLAALQTQMEKATEDEQAKFTLQQARDRGPFGMGREGPLADLEKQRRDLDDATSEKVKALLTPEQAEQLPPRRGGGEGQGGGDGNDRPRRRGGEGAGSGGDAGAGDGSQPAPRRRQRGNGQGERAPDAPA